MPELSAEEIEDLKKRADERMWMEKGGFSTIKTDLERFSGHNFEASSIRSLHLRRTNDVFSSSTFSLICLDRPARPPSSRQSLCTLP